MTLRSILLGCFALALAAMPAAAQQAKLPTGFVTRINQSTGNVEMQDGTQWVPIGTLDPVGHRFVPFGQAAIGATAAQALGVAQTVQPGRPTIAPSTTAVGTSATAVYPAGVYVSLTLRLLTPGVQMACTGDGSAPAIGTSPTLLLAGQEMRWPAQVGGAAPSAAVQCVASSAAAIAGEAH